MSNSLSVCGARTILDGQFFVCREDIPVPFSRAELYQYRRSKAQVFFIPEGSCDAFPDSLEVVHSYEDVRFEQSEGWTARTSPNAFVITYPMKEPYLSGRSLEEQKAEAPGVLLTAYEIACMAAYWSTARKGLLFTGKVRTEEVLRTQGTHLHVHPLTPIMSYDKAEKLRFSRGYTSQVSPELGVMVGRRVLVPS
jgi:hypothetical protein